MALVANGKGNGIDVISLVAPTVRYDGLTWYDLNVDRLKIWNALENAWKADNQFTVQIVRADEMASIGV